MAKFGYARVSTADQELDLQLDALRADGVPDGAIYTDTISGSRAQRPGLTALLAAVQQGDVVVLWRLDRLGRSLRDLADLAHRLREGGVFVRGLVDGVDTSTSAGRLLYGLLGSIAEYERELIRERVSAGMKAAKRNGIHVGRRASMNCGRTAEARRMMQEGQTARQVAGLFRVAPATLFRALVRWPDEASRQ